MSESKDLVDLCVFFFWESVSLEGHGVLAQNTWGGHPLNPIESDGFGPTRCNVVFIYFWSWCFPLFSGLFEEIVKKSEEQNKAMLRWLTPWHWNFLSDWVLGIDFRQWNLWKQRNRLPWQSLRSGGVASLVCDWWKAVCWYKNVGWLRARLV